MVPTVPPRSFLAVWKHQPHMEIENVDPVLRPRGALPLVMDLLSSPLLL